MEFLLDLATTFWQFTVVAILILIGFAINLLDKRYKNDDFTITFKDYPHMQPRRISTSDKGFWGAILMWLLGTRHWTIAKDWQFKMNGTDYVIPKGFDFDGASVPKFLATFLSPVGVLLVGGLVHDYLYKHRVLVHKGKKTTTEKMTQKESDEIFRDVNIDVNGFVFMNLLAFWTLRVAGFVAWNGHRKREGN